MLHCLSIYDMGVCSSFVEKQPYLCELNLMLRITSVPLLDIFNAVSQYLYNHLPQKKMTPEGRTHGRKLIRAYAGNN